MKKTPNSKASKTCSIAWARAYMIMCTILYVIKSAESTLIYMVVTSYGTLKIYDTTIYALKEFEVFFSQRLE